MSAQKPSHAREYPGARPGTELIDCRSDLLKRHLAGHAGPGKPSTTHTDASTPARVTKACRTCASNHLRCTETKPCSRCVEKGLECVWFNPADEDNDDGSGEEDEDTEMQSGAPEEPDMSTLHDEGTPPVSPSLAMTDSVTVTSGSFSHGAPEERNTIMPHVSHPDMFAGIPASFMQGHGMYGILKTPNRS